MRPGTGEIIGGVLSPSIAGFAADLAGLQARSGSCSGSRSQPACWHSASGDSAPDRDAPLGPRRGDQGPVASPHQAVPTESVRRRSSGYPEFHHPHSGWRRHQPERMTSTPRISLTAGSERRCPLRMPEAWAPPVPAFCGDLSALPRPIVVCLGVQSKRRTQPARGCIVTEMDRWSRASYRTSLVHGCRALSQ